MKWHTEVWQVKDLKNWVDNPRTITQEEFDSLKDSVGKLGNWDSLVINTDGTVIAGNQRLKVHIEQGDSEVEVRVPERELTNEEIKEIGVRSNRHSGQWDMDKLADEFTEILEGLGAEDLLKDPYDIDNESKGSLTDTFVVPPFSVLDTRQGYWQERRDFWTEQIRDKGETREGVLSGGESIMADINGGTSILDAVLAEAMVLWFGVPGGLAVDMFAGDTVFGFVAASKGMRFVGTELRQEQVDVNQGRVDAYGLDAKYICDDALNIGKHVAAGSADLVFSCPPYADLEVYSDLPNDLSNMPLDDFYRVYETVLADSYKLLKDNRFAVITVGEVRNKQGAFINLVPKTIDIMVGAGYKYYNELVLVNSAGTAPIRAANSMKNRKVIKLHQNVLVFYKGDIKEIKNHFKLLEFVDYESSEDGTDYI